MSMPPPLPSTWPVPQSVGIRLGAFLIDVVIYFVASFVIGFVYGAAVYDPYGPTPDAHTGLRILIYAFLFLYFFVLQGAFGATAGQAILGLRVVRAADPWKTSWGGAFVRTLLLPVDLFFFGLVGILTVVSSAKRQRIGDMAGRTVVVKKLPWHRVPWKFAPVMPGLMPCPICHGPIWSGMTVCNHCGARWVPDAPAAPVPAVAAPTAPAPAPPSPPAPSSPPL